MNRFIFSCIIALSFIVCNSEKAFEIKGTLTAAADKTLILERRALGGIEFVDSLKIKENGKFSFRGKASDNPEFYQLRIDN